MRNLAPRQRRWLALRITILAALLGGYALRVTARAWELQVAHAPGLRALAEDQYLREIRLAPKRGTIHDRHGAPLAVSVEVESVWADPQELRERGGDPARVARELRALLDVDEARIQRRLASDRRFVWVRRRVTPRLAAALRARKDEVPEALAGVHLDSEARRFYPNGPLAAHVLGFANIDGEGIEGLELALEDELRGSRRTVPAIRDGRRRVVFSEQLLDDRAAQGDDLWLTLDKTLQHVAERELALAVRMTEARAGSVVVMEPASGDILALASYPSYDPNAPGASPASHRRNRAVTDRFEPGSTVKPFTVAAALARGTIRAEESIDCMNGAMEVAEYTIHDSTPYDRLTPAQILAFSSNIGTAQIGSTLGRAGLYRAFRRFGFGEVTGLPLPGEARGILRHHRRWYEMDAATISFGQGLSVTNVQMAAAMAVLANEGRLVRPRLVRRVTRAGEVVRESRPETRRQVVPPAIARLVADMLTAVTGPEGTAPEAAIDGYLVAGKTGTAQKADYVAGGYAEDRWLASFAGFAPARHPRVVISVVIDEPVVDHYGGRVAGPVFRRVGEVALRHLGVTAATGGQALLEEAAAARRGRRAQLRAERAATRELRAARREARQATREGRPVPPEVQARLDAAAPEPSPPAAGEGEVVVPSLLGAGARVAFARLAAASLTPRLRGSGVVLLQRPEPGQLVPVETEVELTLAPPQALRADDGGGR